ncbi:uncharacterized protein VTP21DRAFT_7641 [Calcarisporiella thermophila]|uniref:uncharacterized protein n=1 Tax=Calcarisporiella thermophila TaxID=911321 RepID=UPI0037432EFD
MIDHVAIKVYNLALSKQFYAQLLKPLGHSITVDNEIYCMFGKGEFVLSGGGPAKCHVAFRANSREAVNAFHKAGLEAGGKDNGAPGIRSEYGDTYYAAFLYDLDGNNIEAAFYE